jgi:hypothetical protein
MMGPNGTTSTILASLHALSTACIHSHYLHKDVKNYGDSGKEKEKLLAERAIIMFSSKIRNGEFKCSINKYLVILQMFELLLYTRHRGLLLKKMVNMTMAILREHTVWDTFMMKRHMCLLLVGI